MGTELRRTRIRIICTKSTIDGFSHVNQKQKDRRCDNSRPSLLGYFLPQYGNPQSPALCQSDVALRDFKLEYTRTKQQVVIGGRRKGKEHILSFLVPGNSSKPQPMYVKGSGEWVQED